MAFQYLLASYSLHIAFYLGASLINYVRSFNFYLYLSVLKYSIFEILKPPLN